MGLWSGGSADRRHQSAPFAIVELRPHKNPEIPETNQLYDEQVTHRTELFHLLAG